MIWYDKMHVGKRCRTKVNLLKYKISNRKRHTTVYLIVLPQEENCLLEVIPSVLLLQENYPTDIMHIVGMGATKKEAQKIVEQIISEVYEATGDFQMYSYMQKYR